MLKNQGSVRNQKICMILFFNKLRNFINRWIERISKDEKSYKDKYATLVNLAQLSNNFHIFFGKGYIIGNLNIFSTIDVIKFQHFWFLTK